MKSQHRFSILKDKFYNFCFKDSVVLKKTSRRRLRFYLSAGLLCLIGIASYSIIWKKPLPVTQEHPKPSMIVEPVVVESKVPVAVAVEPIAPPAPPVMAPVSVFKQEEHRNIPIKEVLIEEQPEPEEAVVEPLHPEPVVQAPVKEKPKSTIERVSKGDHEIDALYQKAISFVKHKKFAQARSILQRDDIIRHSYGKALSMLVKILLNERSYDVVETYAKKYLDVYPSEKGEVLLAYGHAMIAHQKYQDLIQAFGKYVPSPEKEQEYSKLLGQAYLKEKKYAEAREIYERLLRDNDNDTKLLMALLISQIGMKDNDAAEITMGKLYQNPLDAPESQALKKMSALLSVQ